MLSSCILKFAPKTWTPQRKCLLWGSFAVDGPYWSFQDYFHLWNIEQVNQWCQSFLKTVTNSNGKYYILISSRLTNVTNKPHWKTHAPKEKYCKTSMAVFTLQWSPCMSILFLASPENIKENQWIKMVFIRHSFAKWFKKTLVSL